MAEATPKKSNSRTILDTVDDYLERRSKTLFWVAIILCALFCLLLFDGKMSFLTDDANYIQVAYRFVHNGSFPSYQGPVYPVFLSFVIRLFGMNLLVFKFFSSLFIVGQVFFMYKAFKGYIPNLVLFSVLFICALNPYILFYGSYTFNEAMLFFIQALAFYFFTRHIDLLEQDPPLSSIWKSWIVFGLFIFLISVTKNIAIVAVGSIALFFLIYKKWREAALTLITFIIFKLPYELMLRLAFKQGTSGQLDQILHKDFYDPSKGYEDFDGYVSRFFTNTGEYFSYHFYHVLGIRPEIAMTQELMKDPEAFHDAESNILFTIIFAGLVILATYSLYKRNKYALLSLFYGLSIAGTITIAVQTIWDQDRLVLPYIPYILIGIFTGLYIWAQDTKFKFVKPIVVFLLIFIPLLTIPKLLEKASANSRALPKYLKGSTTYDYQEPEVNFISMCEWIGANLPADAKVASGKPSEGFVFAKSDKFQRIGKPASKDSVAKVMQNLKNLKVGYLLIDRYGAAVYNTFQLIYKKEPQRLNMIHQEGEGEDACYLFEIKY